MYPLGHIGIALFLSTLFYLPALFAILGVILPDAIDKIFFTFGFLPCGRYLGHNLFFAPILALITFALTKKKNFALAILFGTYLHLLQDAREFIPWFYPLVNYPFDCVPFEVHIGLFEIITESIGASLLIITVFFKTKVLYLREKLFLLIKYGNKKFISKISRKER